MHHVFHLFFFYMKHIKNYREVVYETSFLCQMPNLWDVYSIRNSPYLSHISSGRVCMSNSWVCTVHWILHTLSAEVCFLTRLLPPQQAESQTTVSAAQTRLKEQRCKWIPENCSWFILERVIFSFCTQAFGPTPISTGPWPQMSAPRDMAVNDAPRGTPQSATRTLFLFFTAIKSSPYT